MLKSVSGLVVGPVNRVQLTWHRGVKDVGYFPASEHINPTPEVPTLPPLGEGPAHLRRF